MQMMYKTVVQDSDDELVVWGDLLLESIYLESDVYSSTPFRNVRHGDFSMLFISF